MLLLLCLFKKPHGIWYLYELLKNLLFSECLQLTETMGKISYQEGGGGRHRDSHRRRDRDYQSGRLGRRNDRPGDSRGRSNAINNNRDRDSEDLRSRIGKKSSVEKLAIPKQKYSKVDAPATYSP